MDGGRDFGGGTTQGVRGEGYLDAPLDGQTRERRSFTLFLHNRSFVAFRRLFFGLVICCNYSDDGVINPAVRMLCCCSLSSGYDYYRFRGLLWNIGSTVLCWRTV